MSLQTFEVNDLVWAKMKGYPYWPAKIVRPPKTLLKSKPKKYHHYVLFFGSDNYGWISKGNIELHSDQALDKYGNKKVSFAFLTAVETIVKNSKGVSKYHKSNTSSESDKNTSEAKKQNNNPEKTVSKDVKSNDSPGKKKKILPKNVSLVKDHSIVKKTGRKKNDLSDEIKPGSSANNFCENVEPTPSRNVKHDNYSQLVSNVPSNIENRTSKPFLRVLERNYFDRPTTPPIDLKCKNKILDDKKIKPTNKKIGFLGLDSMTQGIVKNLCQSRHSVIIWNPTPSECQMFAEEFNNIQIADTPADVIEAADITFSCFSDSDEAKQIFFGNCGVVKQLEHSTTSKGYIEMTSISPDLSQTIGSELKGKGCRYLEAPSRRSRLDAINGTLNILAAGDETLYNDSKSCFDAMSKKHRFLGSNLGTAFYLNLIRNMLQATVYASLAESLALLQKLGYERDFLENFLDDDILNNEAIVDKATSVIQNNYVSNSDLKRMQQHLNLSLLLGDKVAQSSPVLSVINEVLKRSMAE